MKPEVLKEYNKNIYWNLIWYFAELKLPYDFIVPYSDTTAYDEYLQSNKHIKVYWKLRLEEHVKKLGGIEEYIKFKEAEVRAKKLRGSEVMLKNKKK